MKITYTPIALSLASLMALVSVPASAHDIYIWPSEFTINANNDTRVIVDVTATDTAFRSGHGMAPEGIEIIAPNGKALRDIGTVFLAKQRTTVDLPITEKGTYQLNYARPDSYISFYKLPGEEKQKRIRHDKLSAVKNMPKGAMLTRTIRYNTKAASYITNGAPTEVSASGNGFEITPLTHPSDFVSGEAITLQVHYNGEPINAQSVMIEREGGQYQAEKTQFKLVSNQQGEISFTPELAGRYVLKSKYELDQADPRADTTITRLFMAFEVVYE